MMKIIGIGLIAFLLFRLQQWVYSRNWNKSLTARVEFASKSIFQGEEGQLLEIVENRKYLPLPMLKVKFQTSRNLEFADMGNSRVTDRFYHNDIFQIGSGEKITRRITFTGKKRGCYKIENIDLVASDLFFSVEMTESREADGYFYVYAKPYNSEEMRQSLKQLNGEIITKRHLQEDPFEYRGIREYQYYDDMRSVNWKATAKTGELKVNQKNYTALQMIRIFFNIEDIGILKREEAVEGCLQIVAGLAENFLRMGISVAVYGNGVDIISGEPVMLEYSAGAGQLERIYKALARVDTASPTVSFADTFGEQLMQTGLSTYTFMVAPNSYEDFMELLEKYQAGGQDYAWFYPTWDFGEPRIPEWAKSHTRVLHLR